MLFTVCHSLTLLSVAVALVFAGVKVSKLRHPTAAYNARLFTFGCFSLSAWILWVFQYAFTIVAPLIPLPNGFLLITDLGLGIMQNALWTSAVLSLYFKLTRKLLSLSLLGVFAVVFAIVTYQTTTSEQFTQIGAVSAQKIFYAVVTPTIFDGVLALTIFLVLGVSILRLGLTRFAATAFLTHGYSQWIWRWLWLTPLGTTWPVQLAFPLWRIFLLIAWGKLISEMEQRAQPSSERFASKVASDTEQPELPDLLSQLRVMISSTVEDLEPERDVANGAIRSLDLIDIRAETFGPVSHPPKAVCAFFAEQCDIFVMIIGERYGYIMSEGISVVEFEYNTARRENPRKILVFVKEGVDRDSELTKFLQRVEDFDDGYFRELFKTPDDLKEKIQRGIARWLRLQVKQIKPKQD